MKSKIYRFNPQIYPYFLYVSKDFDTGEIRKLFRRVLNNSEVTEIDYSIDATLTSIALSFSVTERTTGKVGFLVLIYRPLDATPGLIAHEALHINSFNNALLNIEPPTFENDEPHAYFIQWVVDCIDSVLADCPDEMNGILFKDGKAR